MKKDLDWSDYEADGQRMNDELGLGPDAAHVVIISYPEDPERGFHPHGPFPDEESGIAWADSCKEAADLGWQLLQGAYYHVLRLQPPFDPASLMQDGSDSDLVNGRCEDYPCCGHTDGLPSISDTALIDELLRRMTIQQLMDRFKHQLGTDELLAILRKRIQL